MGNSKQPLATKKKKGRPSLLELQKRNLRLEKSEDFNYALPASRRSRQRNLEPDLQEEDDDDDEESSGRRKEKKLKLVLKAGNGSDSGESGSNLDGGQSRGKREMEDVETEGQNLGSKATIGTTEDSGPTTPLPDKKLLLFILDRLQKKDTYGVFSEPVSSEELPDYHDVIKNPMDFGTIRKKLDSKSYKNLEEFESDIFLITTNAARYNAPDTIYFRQAKTIQELARKDFENLRKESDEDEKERKVVRRGRPPIKHIMRRIGRSLDDHTTSDFSDTPTPVNGTPNSIMTHNQQRKGSAFDKSGMADGYRGYGHNKSEKNVEFSGSPLKGLSMRNWKKNSVIDENRRNTFYQPLHANREQSVLTAFDGERKQLVPVGVYTEHAYARSLARFAANLGPIGWELASRRIERVLPPGMRFGRGWVSEPPLHQNPSSSVSLSSPSSSSQTKPSEHHENLRPVSIRNIENGKLLSGLMQPCRNQNGFQMRPWTSLLDDKGSNSISSFEQQWQNPAFSSSELSQEPSEMNQETPELALQL